MVYTFEVVNACEVFILSVRGGFVVLAGVRPYLVAYDVLLHLLVSGDCSRVADFLAICQVDCGEGRGFLYTSAGCSLFIICRASLRTIQLL